MQLDRDFRELLECLGARDVRFLVVGGYAVAAHGHLLQALDDFGFGALGLVAGDFIEPDRVVQLGYPPVRVDLLTSIDGVDFDECFDRRMELLLDGLPVPFIALDDLRRNKRASGRPQDLADLAALED